MFLDRFSPASAKLRRFVSDGPAPGTGQHLLGGVISCRKRRTLCCQHFSPGALGTSGCATASALRRSRGQAWHNMQCSLLQLNSNEPHSAAVIERQHERLARQLCGLWAESPRMRLEFGQASTSIKSLRFCILSFERPMASSSIRTEARPRNAFSVDLHMPMVSNASRRLTGFDMSRSDEPKSLSLLRGWRQKQLSWVC